MNMSDLIETSAKKSGTEKKEANAVMTAVIETIKEALAKGEEVRLAGFGTFSARHNDAKVGRNPQTGQAINIAASVSAKFKAAKGLSDALNVKAA